MSERETPDDPRASVTMIPIGVVRSPYGMRHGTPQQAPSEEPVDAVIELFADRVPEAAVADLEGMDYVWVLSFLHRTSSWNATVMPPRGPRVRRSVFATRSPHRPNPIGLSAVRLTRVEGHRLHVRGIDLLDGTPVLDVKPYLPYADAFPDAHTGWIAEIPNDAPQLGRPPRPKHLRERGT